MLFISRYKNHCWEQLGSSVGSDMNMWLVLILCVSTGFRAVSSQHYVNEFAVKIDKNTDINELARTHGFRLLRQVKVENL